jgi:hypothetical protein
VNNNLNPNNNKHSPSKYEQSQRKDLEGKNLPLKFKMARSAHPASSLLKKDSDLSDHIDSGSQLNKYARVIPSMPSVHYLQMISFPRERRELI